MGYGGNDEGIATMLEALPVEALPLGAFWTGRREPQRRLRAWLEKRDAVWIEMGSFDELMLLIRDVFDLPHPEPRRFEEVFEKYKATYEERSGCIAALPDAAPDALALKEAVKRADKSFRNWNAVAVAASRLEKTDPDLSERIYQDGLIQFPGSAPLLGRYARFLWRIRKEYDRAEAHYQRALAADPNHAASLGGYGVFLDEVRKDYDGSETHRRRALTANPNDPTLLVGYALFLRRIRRDYDGAEAQYRRALVVDPKDVYVLSSYARFLRDVRKDYEGADTHYQRALEADPNDAFNIGSYARFLWVVRKDYDAAEAHFRRALAAAPNDLGTNSAYAGFRLARGDVDNGLALLDKVLHNSDNVAALAVESWFYAFAHGPAELRGQALRNLKNAIIDGARSPGPDLSENVERARADGHPDAAWLEGLTAVISDGADIDTLDAWPRWGATSGT